MSSIKYSPLLFFFYNNLSHFTSSIQYCLQILDVFFSLEAFLFYVSPTHPHFTFPGHRPKVSMATTNIIIATRSRPNYSHLYPVLAQNFGSLGQHPPSLQPLPLYPSLLCDTTITMRDLMNEISVLFNFTSSSASRTRLCKNLGHNVLN